MKKRIIAAAVCILMLSAFTACAQKPAQNKPSVTETENGSILAGLDETAAPETTKASSESTEAAPKTTESAERHTEAQTSRPAPTTEKRAQTTVKKPEKTTKTETTKAFEYDMSNPAVKAVMSMVGEKHRCTEVAEAAVEQAGLSGWRTFEEEALHTESSSPRALSTWERRLRKRKSAPAIFSIMPTAAGVNRTLPCMSETVRPSTVTGQRTARQSLPALSTASRRI